MDDFNVSTFRVEHTYDVDRRMGTYLIAAGYAVRVDAVEPAVKTPTAQKFKERRGSFRKP